MPCIVCLYHRWNIFCSYIYSPVYKHYIYINICAYIYVYIYCIWYIFIVFTYIYIYKYIYIYVYIYIYIYIYIYMLYIVFVTFIHSVHDFAWFALICYIKILNKKQNKYNYYKQILGTTSVRVSKKNQFSKRYKTRNKTFLLMPWRSVVKFKYFPPKSIISVSRLSLMLCFSINSIFALLIANISTSVLMQTSVANWSSGDGNFTGSPSRRSSKSFQQINSLLHQKSCKIITSALYAPTRHT